MRDEGAPSRSRATPAKPRATAKRKTAPAPDPDTALLSSDAATAPAGSTSSPLLRGQNRGLARDHNSPLKAAPGSAVEQGPDAEGSGAATQLVQTAAYVQETRPQQAEQDLATDPPRLSLGREMLADQKQEASLHRPDLHTIELEGHTDRNSPSRVEGSVGRAARVWGPRLQAASNGVRMTSGRVKVWMQAQAMRKPQQAVQAERSTNPLYILAAITLGIPALILVPLIGLNPGVQDGTFRTVIAFLIVSAFVIAAVFEIKRLADQSSDEEHS